MVKLLYITGYQRSGSTLLSSALGQLPGFFSCGEPAYLWDHVWHHATLCGCGVPVRSCPLWSDVLEKAYGPQRGIAAERMLRLQRTATRTRAMPRLMVPPARRRLLADLQRTGYLADLRRLYVALQEITGCSVIVDSSKWPSYGFLLTQLDDIDVRVLHLVRDPRAVAYSFLRRKRFDDRDVVHYMYADAINSSLHWTSWNIASEVLFRQADRPRMFARYEDFVADPRTVLRRAAELVDEPADLSFAGRDHIDIAEVPHSIAGNTVRFASGRIPLLLDAEWQTVLSRADRARVTAISWPLMRRYGYLD